MENKETPLTAEQRNAYKELFAAVKWLRQESLAQLVDAMNIHARATGCYSCKYSERSIGGYISEPGLGRTNVPSKAKIVHLCAWFTEQTAQIASQDKIREYLAQILPASVKRGAPPNVQREGSEPVERQRTKEEPSSFSKADWENPEVLPFIEKYNLLSIIDGAISLYNGPEHVSGKGFWSVGDVTLNIEDKPIAITELRPFQNEIKKWAETNKDERRGMKYCVTAVKRPTIEGDKMLSLRVRPIEYHFVKPINMILEKSSGSNLKTADRTRAIQFRKRFFPELKDRDYPLIPNMLTLQIAVVSSDNKILFFKRRKRGLHSFEGCWSASLEEGLNADADKYLGTQAERPPFCNPDLDIKSGFHRALKEELRLSDEVNSRTNIKILALLVEFENLNTALAAVARISLTMKDLLSHSGLRSSEEFDSFAYCSFDIPSLLPVLLSKHALPNGLVTPGGNPANVRKEWKWHPTSRMRIYCSLVDQFGANKVNEDIDSGITPRQL